MSSSGYARASGTMWWRMYSGHNCTNYAAYRMVRAGVPNTRPWSGSGSAANWGTAMASITDRAPAVGAVAWWKAGAPSAGSSGHVAYVERVVSGEEIIVSQDSWGGDFSWARVTRTSTGWPSGFIHFADVPLVNTVRPVIDGRARVGSRLTASTGTWRPSGVSTAYQWRAGGVNIAGATGPTLRLTPARLGRRIRVRVAAAALGYPTTTVGSERTTAVRPGVISNTAAPTVTGEARVDSTLTVTPGSWDPVPGSVSYQWLADGKPLEGEREESLKVDSAQGGSSLSATVTAHRPGYASASVTSASTSQVSRGTLATTGSARTRR